MTHSSEDRLFFIERCRRFWNREPVKRAIFGILVDRVFPLRWFTEAREDMQVRPHDLTIEGFLRECSRRHAAAQMAGGDTPFVGYATIGMPWQEAIMGCEVRAAGGVAWPERWPGDWREFTVDSVQWGNGWFAKLQELTAAMVGLADRPYPVGPAHLRGPSDVAASLMGHDTLCLALYDEPRRLHALLDICTDVWITLAQAQYDLLPADQGGHWNGNQPLWAPGRTMFVPADIAAVVSPALFAEFFLPRIWRLVRSLPFSIMHTHSSYLHSIRPLLEIDELRAVQVGIDLEGPPLEQLLPQLRAIQERKPLIVAGQIDARQVRTLLRQLAPEGLCVLAYPHTPEEGRALWQAVHDGY